MKNRIFESNVRAKLIRKDKVNAAWIQTGSNITAEIFAEAGFDMIVIDAEHSPTHLLASVSMMQAVKGTNCFPMVRVPWNDLVSIKQVLDIGTAGVHIPYVSTREEAEKAVLYCKYPPLGIRGIAGSQRAVCYGMNKKAYYENANNEIIVMIAIETYEGVENIQEIIQVGGIDGIFIGPADLSTSMGYIGNPSHPEVQKAISKVEDVVLNSNKFLGTVASGVEDAIEKYNRGYNLLYTISDTTCISTNALNQIEQFNRYKSRL